MPVLSSLKQAHTELLEYISELEAAVSENAFHASTVARLRLQLSKASGRRRKIVSEAMQWLSEGAATAEARQLNLLRENDAAMLAATSSHVRDWSIDAIVADGEGYRAASAMMRKSMRSRIALEKSVLYPLLERAARRP